MDVRRDENYRESWYITNISTNNITIGDLLMLPVILPGKTVDALKFYTREKIGQSVILTDLVKSGVVTFYKKKIYTNSFPGAIGADDIDEAITSAEENELIDIITTGEEITDDTKGVILHGKDQNDTAQPISISGAENNGIMTMDLDLETLLEDIYLELIKANMQMSIMTGNHIKNKDIDSMQKN